VELTASTAAVYLRLALRQMRALVERMDDGQLNERPPGPATNSVAALVTHCHGVCEFWLGHVGLGRPSTRDRDGEFTAVATAGELHGLIDAMEAQVVADVERLDAGGASDTNREGRQFLEAGDASDAALVVHVIEELFQHLGQMELTADVLGVAPAGEG
jgi:uncharacterized damage-inducible protein DinB